MVKSEPTKIRKEEKLRDKEAFLPLPVSSRHRGETVEVIGKEEHITARCSRFLHPVLISSLSLTEEPDGRTSS